MKATNEKTTATGGTASPGKASALVNGNHRNPSKVEAVKTKTDPVKQEAKEQLKQAGPIERILNDLEVLNSRKENREHLLETLKKLKSFNPMVTESRCELIIKDKHSEFRTTATEPMKMIVNNYILIVEDRLREVERDIHTMAVKLSAI